MYVCTLKGNYMVKDRESYTKKLKYWSITVTETKEQLLQWTHVIISYLHVSYFINCTFK